MRTRWWIAGWVVIGTFLAHWISFHSPTTSPECFEANVCDGLAFRVVGEILVEGGDPYDPATRLAHLSSRVDPPPFDLPFQYPPPALPWFALRAFGSPLVNAGLWTTLTTAAALIALAALLGRQRMAWVALAATWPVAWLDATLAQTGALATALAAGTLALSGSPVAAGILLGALSFKPHYALPLGIAAAAAGQWRLVGVAVATALGLCAFATLVWGPDTWTAFAGTLGSPNPTAPFMASWLGPASRWSPDLAALAWPVFGLGVLLVGAGIVVAVRRGWAWQTAAIGGLGALLVFSPNTHPYDLGLVLPALALLVPARYPTRAALAATLLWLVPMVTLPGERRWVLTVLLAGVTVAWAVALVRDREPRMPAER